MDTKLAMVIDDSRAMRGILKRILLPLGFEVREATNGKDALDQIWDDNLQPGLALIDWNMPEMNGLEFVMAVRKQKHLRQMTLMMVTTESEHGQIVRALAAGAHEYVIKPFTAEAIVDKLAYLGLVPLSPPTEAAGSPA
ncbi:response regulator [Dactylosporangium fulvum]|uniref:Response regulator n=1 Tax=Dactylosporangium fulvum TaxID=53359 RepID=A0ABY5W601_9ACTN|nr:response regulator [Dactylosporangium fulvum]UWP84694.1 response regulator [Dactylosporangium fulvum]